VKGTHAHAFVSSFCDLNDVKDCGLLDPDGEKHDFHVEVLTALNELGFANAKRIILMPLLRKREKCLFVDIVACYNQECRKISLFYLTEHSSCFPGQFGKVPRIQSNSDGFVPNPVQSQGNGKKIRHSGLQSVVGINQCKKVIGERLCISNECCKLPFVGIGKSKFVQSRENWQIQVRSEP